MLIYCTTTFLIYDGTKINGMYGENDETNFSHIVSYKTASFKIHEFKK